MTEPTPLNPVLAAITQGSHASLADFKRRAEGLPADLVDLGVGDPRAHLAPGIRDALVAGIPEVMTYPTAAGLPELREAVAGWYARRFGVEVDAATRVLPTHGSKEAIATFALAVSGRGPGEGARGERSITVVPSPAYSTPERGAQFAGSEVLRLPLLAENDFLPDISSVPAVVWNDVAVMWVNYPNNPTGAVAPLEFYDTVAALAAKYGFYLASDEPYTETYHDGDPPPSALQAKDTSMVVVFNSLSKRSGLTGLRSGCIVGPEALVAALRALRATLGLTSQEFVQRAAAWAWSDEAHVAALRDAYTRKHAIFLDVFDNLGLEVYGRRATPYLWVPVPGGETSEGFARRLLAAGVLVTPGSFFGNAGEGFVRIAAMASDGDCERAAAVLRTVVTT